MKQEPKLTAQQSVDTRTPPVTGLLPSGTEDGQHAVAFIRANWHLNIVDRAREGFVAELQTLAGNSLYTDIYDVPGAYEIPLLAKRLAKSGRYAAIVGAAFVVNGGIYRHDFVADTVVSALMQAQMETEVPMFSVILTPHHYQETDPHNDFFRTHFVLKGQEAARAVTATLSLHDQLAAIA